MNECKQVSLPDHSLSHPPKCGPIGFLVSALKVQEATPRRTDAAQSRANPKHTHLLRCEPPQSSTDTLPAVGGGLISSTLSVTTFTVRTPGAKRTWIWDNGGGRAGPGGEPPQQVGVMCGAQAGPHLLHFVCFFSAYIEVLLHRAIICHLFDQISLCFNYAQTNVGQFCSLCVQYFVGLSPQRPWMDCTI